MVLRARQAPAAGPSQTGECVRTSRQTGARLGGLIVLDASAAVEIVLRTDLGSAARRLLTGRRLIVPAHFDAEVLGAVTRLTRERVITEVHAAHALRSAAALQADRVPIAPVLVQAYALRERFSPGDALYVVVARSRSAALLSTDRRLLRAAASLVEVLVPEGLPPATA